MYLQLELRHLWLVLVLSKVLPKSSLKHLPVLRYILYSYLLIILYSKQSLVPKSEFIISSIFCGLG